MKNRNENRHKNQQKVMVKYVEVIYKYAKYKYVVHSILFFNILA